MVDSEAPRTLRWGRIIGVAVLLFLAAEAFARLYVRVWAGQSHRSLAPYTWSPYGLVRNNPRLTSPSFRINANGFRNTAPFAQKKPPNTIRVILLGGSVLYSGSVPGAARVTEARVTSDETIAQHLEHRMRADPALAGLSIEVINAGVNYNQVREVTVGYLSEYVFWDPDIVVVCGSANNFGPLWPSPLRPGELNSIQAVHPWRPEFERLVNSHSLASALEAGTRSLGEHSAAIGLATKAFSRSVSIAASRSNSLSFKKAPPAASERQFADSAEIHEALRDYLGYADAMISSASRHRHHIAFFWEYFLGEMEGHKPLSAEERRIFPHIRWRVIDQRDREFHFMVRDTLRREIESRGAGFIDPLPLLSRDSGTVFIDYLHYTSYGNRLMAGAIYTDLAPHLHARASVILSKLE